MSNVSDLEQTSVAALCERCLFNLKALIFGGHRPPLQWLLILGMTLFAGCQKSAVPDGSEEKRGAALFESEGCAACHQVGGAGGELKGVTTRRTYAWFESYLKDPSVAHPISMMPAYPELQAEEVKALWTFFQDQDKAAGLKMEPLSMPFNLKIGITNNQIMTNHQSR